MTEPDTELLGELIRRKLDCLLQLRDVGLRQLELVRDGRMSELLDVLAVKQRMLLDLQAVERSLDPFRGQDPETRPWRTPQARDLCARRLDDCQRLLAEIVRQEKQSEQEMIRRRDETAAQLQGVHHACRARGAYAGQSAARSGGIDFTSEA